MMTIGLLLLAVALLLSGYNIWQSIQGDKYADAALNELIPEINQNSEKEDVAQPDYVLFPDKEMPVKLIDGMYYVGVLQFPELNVTLPIIDKEWTLEKLNRGPCRYVGSPYKDNMVLAGHNDFPHFRPIYDLTVGSEVIFTDMDGNVFKYKVAWTEVLLPTEADKIIDSKDWDLSLMTCTFTSMERYIVRCIRVK